MMEMKKKKKKNDGNALMLAGTCSCEYLPICKDISYHKQ